MGDALLMTSAGSAAGIDLCLHLVREDFGSEAAKGVARRLVVSPHRDGGQAQQVLRPVARSRESLRLGPVSYTHLDVYKRQTSFSRSSCSLLIRARRLAHTDLSPFIARARFSATVSASKTVGF